MDIFITLGLVLMVWMCLDCIQRKEHFIWIVIMVVLFPVGAVIYYFAVKNKGKKRGNLFPMPSKPKEVETEDTLHLKELIKKHEKAFHYEKLGQLYFDQKNYELAIPQFEAAIKKDPEMNEARYGLAKSLHGLGKFTEAIEVLEALTKEDKKFDYGNAIFGLAECYRLAGMDEKALATYKDVIDSFAFFKAYYHYGRLLDKIGQKQEAIDQMKSLIGSSKDLPEYKLEKERYWIEEAYKFLRKNGIELA
jgi:tetratricopeptide (TPR) repeat protein